MPRSVRREFPWAVIAFSEGRLPGLHSRYEDHFAARLFTFLKDLVAARGLLQRHMVSDNLLRGKQPLLNKRQQIRQPGVDVGLSHPEGQSFIKGIAKHKAVDETGVNPGYADDAAAAHGGDALAQGFSAAPLDFQGAEDGFRKATFRLEAHGVDHRVDAAMARRVIDNPLRRIVMVVKVYRDRAIALLREIESVIVMIDDKYLFCAIEPGAGGAEQAYRAGAKIATLLPGLTSAFFNRLPGGGQNI